MNANLSGDLRVRISSTAEDFFYKLCGKNGVQTTVYIETDADKHIFSVVPMEMNRGEALLAAKNHERIFCVVPMKNGTWGFRVKTAEYETMVKILRPKDDLGIIGPT